MRPPFLDDVSAAKTCSRASVIGHRMSPDYRLEHPVDDPDDDEDDEDDDDFDEADDDEDDDGDEEEVETWQVLGPDALR